MYASNVSGTLAARWAGVPVVVSQVHSLHEWTSLRRQFVGGRVFRLVDMVVAVSSAVREDLVARFPFVAQRCVTIHNGVDMLRFSPGGSRGMREVVGAGAGDVVIGTVARLVPVKGLEYLLQAAGILLKKYANLRFVVVGSGGLRGRLEELARDLGILGRVVFVGGCDDVVPWLSSFDMLVLPSLTEGFGVSVLEACACGLPVVVTKVGGLAEIVQDGVNGWLVPPANPRELAEAIGCLVRYPEKRVQMGMAGRRMVEERFSLEAILREWRMLYEGLLQRKGIYR